MKAVDMLRSWDVNFRRLPSAKGLGRHPDRNRWLFEITDKDGTSVRLTPDRWQLHIITKHKEVDAHLSEMQEVIRSPGIITRDEGGAHHLSRLGAVGGRWKQLYLEVVVRYEGNPRTGTVVTVFFNSMPPRGELIWLTK